MACNTEVFNAWLAQQLCPLLTDQPVVVLDKATFHKSAKTRELITDRGARLLFLPPYSPDLNPIGVISPPSKNAANTTPFNPWTT